MIKLEYISFVATLMILGLSLLFSVWYLVILSKERPSSHRSTPSSRIVIPAYISLILTLGGLLFLSLSIVTRAVATGHGPFSNMYEFSIAFAWGIMVAGLVFGWHYQTIIVRTVSVVIAFGLLVFAYTLPSQAIPLVPALQQSALLTAHVTVAIIAYGTFTIGFGTAILYLIQRRQSISWLPGAEILDAMSYHTVVIGFPFMSLTIILGALWADIAWGRYWGWDPKETASLITWLLYAGYLHARVLRGWLGTRAAILLIIGFAAVLFTFFGNYIFNGLHSYL